MTATLYDDRCTPCQRKQLWRELKAKAAEKRVLLTRRDVRKDAEAKYDAEVKYALPLPFIVDERGVAMSVEDFLR